MALLDDLIKEPFGADAVRELCGKSGLFSPGRLYRRIEISERLREEFVEHGGDSSTTNANVATVLKKWLLASASPFRREARGRYRFLGHEGGAGEMPHTEARINSVNDAPADDGLTPELEIAEGPCEVYAWCLPWYQATAGPRWPIQIGRAGTEGFKRRLHDFHENLPERPRYLLRLGCADDAQARRREMLLHAWFTSRGQKIEKVSGNEWFRTNPGEIREAIRNITGANHLARGENIPESEDIIADAFSDVTADDWEQLPEDLTDHLDKHLYGEYLR